MLEIYQYDKADRRSSVKIYFHGFRGLGAQDVRWTSVLRGPEWNGDFPQQAKNAFCVHKCTACQVAKLGMKERIRQWKM